MNALLPRRSAESACLFCRQGLVRQWRQQQQRQNFLGRNTSSASVQPLFAPSQQRRRFLSGTAAAQMPPPPFAQLTEQATSTTSSTTAAANSKTSSTTSPYTRYSLYTEPASPMTMRPPPPPSPVVPVESPTKSAKEALKETPAAAAEQSKPAVETTKEKNRPPAAATTAATTAPTPAAAPKPKRPSKLRAPRKAAMRLTPAAVEQVRELLEGPEPKLIKIGVRNRGCSGLAYNLEYVEKPGAFDELVEQDGVKVLVDSKALFSIIGSEMDWVEDKLNQRFVFRNPNIKEECGCGESFMV